MTDGKFGSFDDLVDIAEDDFEPIVRELRSVILGFYQGAKLPDPEALLEGTGKNMRHVKIQSLGDINRAAVKALLQAALSERQNALSA